MSKEAQYIELLLEIIEALEDNGLDEPAAIARRKFDAIRMSS